MNTKSAARSYRGDGLSPVKGKQPFPYLAGPELVEAVNMAIFLGRPLLIKGEPGSGKTALAESISHELGLTLREWFIKSTSQARDGLYTIDVLRRLQDAQRPNTKPKSLSDYITFGQLGDAIRENEESVLLIDEIDKADLDFPNDLLREIDRMEFEIEELAHEPGRKSGSDRVKRTYKTPKRPIVVITSNDEKELPDAFLRRCLFHYISFPSDERLLEIVQKHTADLELAPSLCKAAVDRLLQFRKVPGLRKPPSTSELLDWVRILEQWGIATDQLIDAEKLTDVPFWKTLFKHQQDVKAVERVSGQAEIT